MEITATVFWTISTAVGALMMFGLLLWLGGHVLVKVLKLLKVWHTLLLVVAVAVKGKAYRDKLFWEAIREHIGDHKFAAKNVAGFAYRCCPYDEDTTL